MAGEKPQNCEHLIYSQYHTFDERFILERILFCEHFGSSMNESREQHMNNSCAAACFDIRSLGDDGYEKINVCVCISI